MAEPSAPSKPAHEGRLFMDAQDTTRFLAVKCGFYSDSCAVSWKVDCRGLQRNRE
ncbi:unnamed protein product, partial [Ixodes hexagonus]